MGSSELVKMHEKQRWRAGCVLPCDRDTLKRLPRAMACSGKKVSHFWLNLYAPD
jgi:hypothetical protein